MRAPQPDRDRPPDGVAALIAAGEAEMERRAKGGGPPDGVAALIAAGEAEMERRAKDGGPTKRWPFVKVVSQEELDRTPSPITGIDHRQVQKDIKEMLQRKLDAGHTLYGRREDGALVERTKFGDKVLEPAPDAA